MTGSNTEQAEYWSSHQGLKWIDREHQLDAALAPVLDHVFDLASPLHGKTVLDVGCGTGDSTTRMAHAVGPTGGVTGLDISAPLLDRARARAERLGNVSFKLGDAQTEALGAGQFDLMISRFGVMFFSDPVTAFANIAHALKPGAAIVFAAWADVKQNPWFLIPHLAACDRMGKPPQVDRNAPGPLAFHDRDRVSGILEAAGLSDIKARGEQIMLTPPGDAAAVAELITHVGPATRVLQHFGGTEKDRLAIQHDVTGHLARFASPQGVRVPAFINFFECSKPD